MSPFSQVAQDYLRVGAAQGASSGELVEDEFPTRGDVLHHPLDPCGVARPQHGIVESEDEGDARMQPDRQTAGRNLIAGSHVIMKLSWRRSFRPDHDLQMRESLVVDLNRAAGSCCIRVFP